MSPTCTLEDMLIWILEGSRVRGVSIGGKRINCVSFVTTGESKTYPGRDDKKIQMIIIKAQDGIIKYDMKTGHKD